MSGKTITDKVAIETIIRKSRVCRLGLAEMNHPYIVPLCFGYKENELFFHSAQQGKKLRILKANNNVCFEVDIDKELVLKEEVCKWTMSYQSVIGFGKAYMVRDRVSKLRAINCIIRHYGGKPLNYNTENLESIEIIKVKIESMFGKEANI